MLDTQFIQCPYCWEDIEIVVDPSEPDQQYVEDCFVCCRPIHLHIQIDYEGDISITARSEDEDY